MCERMGSEIGVRMWVCPPVASVGAVSRWSPSNAATFRSHPHQSLAYSLGVGYCQMTMTNGSGGE